ncbi:MAG: anhydro-N-acetylmuramic acid kinase [Halioglobus sp.]|nr:anhydro-N-acetylmuramic acid kinase [Halioglobus sp.]
MSQSALTPLLPEVVSRNPPYVGLMSGTSVDAIDCALVHCDEAGVTLEATHRHPIPDAMRRALKDLSRPGIDEIQRMGELDCALGQLFGEATLELLDDAGVEAAGVAAIGCHGQTVRHVPPGEDPGFTVQIGDPNTIAEISGITTVADFRRRDMACGGQGAPLAPAFHAAFFSAANIDRAIVNLGGIANISLLRGNSLHAGYDTGPANTLLDHWHARHGRGPIDNGGEWAAGGRVLPDLLHDLMSDPFFARRGPRSTGVEYFNLEWLDTKLQGYSGAGPRDVQATLAELTAATVARALRDSDVAAGEIYVCGGGVHNLHLMQRLQSHVGGTPVASTDTLGLPPDWVEAAGFAWLARQRLAAQPGNEPRVTGAKGRRILGGVYLP